MTEVLLQLAAANLKELHYRRSDGKRTIEALGAQCRQLLSTVTWLDGSHASDGVGIFFSVLDFAVVNGFGCWVLDYVSEVCGDSRLTSNDPFDAQLLDGSLVRSWCLRTLAAIRRHLTDSLKHDAVAGNTVVGNAQEQQKQLQAICVIISVLKALGGAQGTDMNTSTLETLSEAEQLERALQLSCWASLHGVARCSPPSGTFQSLPDWKRRVQQRKEHRAYQDEALLLEDLLRVVDFMGSYPFTAPGQAVSSVSLLALGGMGTPYPAPGLERMSHQQQIMAATLDRLEGDGNAAGVPAGWWCSSSHVKRTEQRLQACLALLVYYLVDLGVIRPGEEEGADLVSSLSSTFKIPSGQMSTFLTAPLLDDAAVEAAAGQQQQQHDSSSMSSVRNILLSHPPQHLSIKTLKLLTALGSADVALQLDRAQQQSCLVAYCEEDFNNFVLVAQQLVHIRLSCNLLAEALSLARSLSQRPSKEEHRDMLQTALMHMILDWIASQPAAEGLTSSPAGFKAAALLELFCNQSEEAILVSWLRQQALNNHPIASILPTILAARGYLAEAIASISSVPAVPQPYERLYSSIIDCAGENLPHGVMHVQVEPLDHAAMAQHGVTDLSLGMAGMLQGWACQLDTSMPPMKARVAIGKNGHALGVPLISSSIPPKPVTASAAASAQQASTSSEQEAASGPATRVHEVGVAGDMLMLPGLAGPAAASTAAPQPSLLLQAPVQAGSTFQPSFGLFSQSTAGQQQQQQQARSLFSSATGTVQAAPSLFGFQGQASQGRLGAVPAGAVPSGTQQPLFSLDGLNQFGVQQRPPTTAKRARMNS